MQSIEDAWALFEFREGDGGYEDAARDLALTVHWEMVEIIRPLAPLVGKTDMAALYKANDAGVDLRARIEALGK